jgi:hypothetical protein
LSPYNVLIFLDKDHENSEGPLAKELETAILYNTIPIITSENILSATLNRLKAQGDEPQVHWDLYRVNNNSPKGTLLVLYPSKQNFKSCTDLSDEGLCGFNKLFLTKMEYQNLRDLKLFDESYWSIEDLKQLFDIKKFMIHGICILLVMGGGVRMKSLMC